MGYSLVTLTDNSEENGRFQLDNDATRFQLRSLLVIHGFRYIRFTIYFDFRLRKHLMQCNILTAIYIYIYNIRSFDGKWKDKISNQNTIEFSQSVKV